MKQHWSRRLLCLLCTAVLLLSLCPAAFAAKPGTAGLPNDWWPLWEAYTNAVASGSAEQIYQKGLAVEQLYTKQTRNIDIANQLAIIYARLLTLRYFENKADYAGAAANTKKLIDVAQYLTKNGVDYSDSVVAAQAHLDVMGPFTGVYAASSTKGNSYGSKLAPASGTWYGSVFQGYLAESGKGSIASVYVELADESVESQDYILSELDDGRHTIEINLNYTHMGATARAVIAGQCDANIDSTLRCLAKHNCPIVLRIGGEMNIWSDAKNPTADYVSPADYIASYRYIADKARSICPEVELVWSPMYSVRWGESFDMFYPGDNYVDWVGLSFYYNYADKGYTEASWLEHNRIHEFADPLLCIKNIAEFAAKHGKPVIATEGGAYKNGPKGEAYAAAANAKAFAVVTMVYPQVKAMVYFDKNISETDGMHDYTMEGSFRTAALEAIESNPALISAGESSAATYVPLEQFNEAADKLIIGATGYTYNDTDMKVSYSLDGGPATAGTGAANRYELTAEQLGGSAHTLKVTFIDKKGYTETKTYNITAAGGTIRCGSGAAPKPLAYASTQNVLVDGKPVEFQCYALKDANGYDTNYIKVRDLAYVLNGTAAQFNVGWDGAVNLETKKAYASNGSEMNTPFSGNRAYQASAAETKVDGSVVKLESIVLNDDNGGGYTYYKLRDLGAALGFTVDWSAEKGVYIETK